MSVTSANPHDLMVFVDGSSRRIGRLATTLQAVGNKANVVMPACSGAQFPSTPSIKALNELLTAWGENQEFVRVVHDDLVKADTYDGDGIATVSDAVVKQTLKANGLDDAPDLVDVDAIELYGQPPYSGFKDDPICLANGNFLLRDGDLRIFGVGGGLSVVRTYNSRDRRPGAFGPGWSSLVDVGLAVEDRRVTFRGPDGSGSVFQQRDDGAWVGGERRRHQLLEIADGWQVVEGRDRTWTFDGDGTLTGCTAVKADIVVARDPGSVRATDRTSGRWVTYELDGAGQVTSVDSSDGRRVTYDRDADGRVVAVHRDLGDTTYEHDEHGFLAAVVDADGIAVCRNTYDADGRVLTQVEEHGRQTTYDYRADGVCTVTASDGAPPNVMVHDRRGRMTAMIDGLGNTMRIAYDDHDQIVQVVDRTGATTRYAHDARGNVVAQTDPDGTVQRCEWDDADRLVAQTDRAGNVTRFAYEGDGRDPVLIVTADGAEVHATYGPHGLPTSVVDADGVSATLEWDRDGLLAAVVDGLGARIAFEYDAAGRSIGAEAPDGQRASVALNPAGRVLALRTGYGERAFAYTAAGRLVGGHDEVGTAWEATLDAAGDVAELRDAVGPLVSYERDLIGQVTATVDADGARTTYEHDPVGRRTAVVDPAGNRTEVDHDPEGRTVQVTDPTGRRASCELDVMGRSTIAVGPGGGTTILSYHPNGELASSTDPAGNEWTYEVDAMGRVVASTDPAGATTTYAYTPGGRLAEVRSPLGRTLRREYDAAGRLARIVEPDGTEVVFERRADGATARVLRDGVPTSYDHDETGRATAIAGPWGSVATHREAGVVTAVEHGGDAAARFAYDPRGLLAQVADPAGVITRFTRDRCGRIVEDATAGSTHGFSWDAAGRLAGVTDPYGNETTFERDPRGNVVRVGRPDGTATVRSFGPDGLLDGALDGDGRPLLRLERDANGAVVAATSDEGRLAITYDAVGQVTAMATDGATVRYTWDADGDLVGLGDDTGFELGIERDEGGRIVGYQPSGGPRIGAPEPVALERDDARRVVADERGRRFTYDLAGRLAGTTVDGETTTFDYDDLGLLASEHTPVGVRRYRYGRAGELEALVDVDGTETTFTYDATGRRTAEAGSDGSRVAYRWDAFGRLVGVTRTTPDGSQVEHRIDRDPLGRPMRVDGVPILWDSAAGSGLLGIGDERYAWSAGQVRVVTDPDGAWDRRVGDDPWGHDGGAGVRLGYRGELAVDDLLLLGARAYDTRTRCFLSRDPLPSTPGAVTFAGTYAYAWNDPVNLVDPSGEHPLSDEEYDAFREQASKGMFKKMAEYATDHPWKFIAKAAIVVGGIAVMTLAAATLGPGGLIVAGAVVGALSNGLNAKIDGKNWNDTGRDMFIGGMMGGLTGGLNRFVPPSVASTLTGRLASDTLRNGALEYGSAYAGEGLDSYVIPGGDRHYDASQAFANGTYGTIGGVSGSHLDRITTPNLRGALDGETPHSLLPDPARNTVLDINTASAADLQRVRGIGPATSRAIIEARNANGGFASTHELLEVRGVGPGRLNDIVGAGGVAR